MIDEKSLAERIRKEQSRLNALDRDDHNQFIDGEISGLNTALLYIKAETIASETPYHLKARAE